MSTPYLGSITTADQVLQPIPATEKYPLQPGSNLLALLPSDPLSPFYQTLPANAVYPSTKNLVQLLDSLFWFSFQVQLSILSAGRRSLFLRNPLFREALVQAGSEFSPTTKSATKSQTALRISIPNPPRSPATCFLQPATEYLETALWCWNISRFMPVNVL